MDKGKIFVLVSPSGSGKSTLRDLAIKKINNLEKVITMTSREPRDGELDGIDYHFRNKEEIQNLYSRGELLEMVESYGNLYGTPASSVSDPLNSGKNIILILDVYGKIKFDKLFENVSIFINPPSVDILKSRLLERENNKKTPNLEDINTRIERSKIELELSKTTKFDYIIDGTKSLDDCSNALINIIVNLTDENTYKI